MSSRRRVKTRTQRCDAAQARKRLADARLPTKLVAQVQPGGEDAAKALARQLRLKNDAEYGLTTVSRANRELAIRQAKRLLAFATAVVDRAA